MKVKKAPVTPKSKVQTCDLCVDSLSQPSALLIPNKKRAILAANLVIDAWFSKTGVHNYFFWRDRKTARPRTSKARPSCLNSKDEGEQLLKAAVQEVVSIVRSSSASVKWLLYSTYWNYYARRKDCVTLKVSLSLWVTETFWYNNVPLHGRGTTTWCVWQSVRLSVL